MPVYQYGVYELRRAFVRLKVVRGPVVREQNGQDALLR